MKKISIIFMLLVTTISSYAQKSVKREIITFEHFKMVRPDSAKYDALLHYDIMYNYKFIKRKVNDLSFYFKVNPVFYPKKSYFFSLGYGKDSLLLKHEQGHADTVVLNARKFLVKLNRSSYAPSNYYKRIKTINKEAWDLILAEQNLYDAETSHGLDKACQEKWNQKFNEAFR